MIGAPDLLGFEDDSGHLDGTQAMSPIDIDEGRTLDLNLRGKVDIQTLMGIQKLDNFVQILAGLKNHDELLAMTDPENGHTTVPVSADKLKRDVMQMLNMSFAKGETQRMEQIIRASRPGGAFRDMYNDDLPKGEKDIFRNQFIDHVKELIQKYKGDKVALVEILEKSLHS